MMNIATCASLPAAARWIRGGVASALVLFAAAVLAIGIPPAYGPLVVEPAGGPDHAEFDLRPAQARAQRENKRLYVYLGASDCPYCRRYEAFLLKNATELVPHFKPWLIVDLRSALSTTAQKLYIRVGDTALPYADFQRSINDERARMLVYPSVWVMDTQLKPLMQMPAGTGTFQTVEEQLEILQLVQ
jgi:thiol-disulfide isomerase/thioredoxin